MVQLRDGATLESAMRIFCAEVRCLRLTDLHARVTYVRNSRV